MPDLKAKHCKGMTQHDNYLPAKAFGSFKTTQLANKLICICGSHWVGFEWNDIIWYDNCYDMGFFKKICKRYDILLTEWCYSPRIILSQLKHLILRIANKEMRNSRPAAPEETPAK